ncbi:MAG: D-amino acid aminotransferase [Firmicutes bacterium]|nr:D-amino acid aminotransferase [Bacillota bacterium]
MPLAYVNGEYCQPEEAVVPALDRGFIFGDGVYEVISCINGKLFLLEEHLERYTNGVKEIMIENAPSAAELAELCREIVARDGLKNGYVYVQVTRGAAPRVHHFPSAIKPTVFLFTAPAHPPSQEQKKNGVFTIMVPDERWDRCNVKSVNLLPNCLAKEKAKRAGAYEAIMVRKDVGVTEGSSSSVFAVIGETLYTSPNGPRILPGVTRNTVVKLARQLGIKVKEIFLSPEDFLKANEVFLTGTSFNVLPVKQIDQTRFPVENYRITFQLQDELERKIKEFINSDNV